MKSDQHRSLGHVSPITRVLQVITYIVLLIVLFSTLWTANWKMDLQILGVLLMLMAYTLVLVLPVSWFKITPSSIEAELQQLLRNEPTPPASEESTKEAEAAVSQSSRSLSDPGSVFLDLSIEIERIFREIAISRGLPERMPMGALIRELRQRRMVTDPWLLDAVQLFAEKRNRILHEGKVGQIQSAIQIGTLVLARLKGIEPEKTLLEEVREALQEARISFEVEPRLTVDGKLFEPDFVIPSLKKPLCFIEVKGTPSIVQAYEIASLGRHLKSSYPKIATMLVAIGLSPEMRSFLISRSWDRVFETVELRDLISAIKGLKPN